ncbi:MAG: hypothetical protein QOD87_2450, partial [Pseudonocardiales bacterium]|nr:hypothetical protein [Pseudonocardiales bacterium]
ASEAGERNNLWTKYPPSTDVINSQKPAL